MSQRCQLPIFSESAAFGAQVRADRLALSLAFLPASALALGTQPVLPLLSRFSNAHLARRLRLAALVRVGRLVRQSARHPPEAEEEEEVVVVWEPRLP